MAWKLKLSALPSLSVILCASARVFLLGLFAALATVLVLSRGSPALEATQGISGAIVALAFVILFEALAVLASALALWFVRGTSTPTGTARRKR